MQELKRKYVIPGDKIVDGNFRPSMNAIRVGNSISATRVPRLIGKRGSMIQTIEQATQTRVLIGQNGIVVVTGRTVDGIELAVKAIRMVEEEAHTSNLTQRIKVLLNVQDTTPLPQSAPASTEASPSKTELSEPSNQGSSTTAQTGVQSNPTGIQESPKESREQERHRQSSTQQIAQESLDAPVLPSDSSSSFSADVSLPSSRLEGHSQDEKSGKVDDVHSAAIPTRSTEARKTKNALKGAQEGLQEHGKKEEGT